LAAGLVDEQREMRDLRETCRELLARVEREVTQHQELREKMSGLGASLDEARQRAHGAEIALVSAEKDRKKTAEQMASIEHRLSTMNVELADIGQKLRESGHEQAEGRSRPPYRHGCFARGRKRNGGSRRNRRVVARAVARSSRW